MHFVYNWFCIVVPKAKLWTVPLMPVYNWVQPGGALEKFIIVQLIDN